MASIPFLRISPTTTTFNLKPPLIPFPSYRQTHIHPTTLTKTYYNSHVLQPNTSHRLLDLHHSLHSLSSTPSNMAASSSTNTHLSPLSSTLSSLSFLSTGLSLTLPLLPSLLSTWVLLETQVFPTLLGSTPCRLTLDELLVLPVLLQRVFSPARAGFWFKVMVWFHNLLFVFAVLCFVYSVGCCVLGRTPYLPFVADAAGRQI